MRVFGWLSDSSSPDITSWPCHKWQGYSSYSHFGRVQSLCLLFIARISNPTALYYCSVDLRSSILIHHTTHPSLAQMSLYVSSTMHRAYTYLFGRQPQTDLESAMDRLHQRLEDVEGGITTRDTKIAVLEERVVRLEAELKAQKMSMLQQKTALSEQLVHVRQARSGSLPQPLQPLVASNSSLCSGARRSSPPGGSAASSSSSSSLAARCY
ncbi:hypothetical protein HDK64DRAFT_47018 [Phyllosticta capitalensis]